MSASTDNPYVGLRPFSSDESLLFFGRSTQVIELLQRLHAHHFVAVVGGSGSGKSSLVRAGLIPALKAGYLVDDSDAWNIGMMKPGRAPLQHMADALTHMADPDASDKAVAEMLVQIEEGGADVILDLLEPIYRRKRTNFFLLVDQFEELFRYSMEDGDYEQRDQAIDFVNIMLELSDQDRVPIYVVLTMRSDFIGDCAEFHGLPEAMNRSLYLVPRMNRQDLKQVIESPAKLFGKQVNQRLTSRLLNAMNRVKDELPLLQHALMRMWEFEAKHDQSGSLDIADYDAIGRLDKALSQHANEALETMSKSERKLAGTIFKALTAVDANGRKIRRPSVMSELKQLSGNTEAEIREVIDKFIEGRRSFIIVGNEDDPVIDISHESLIRQWKQLDRWAEQEAKAAKNYLKLTDDYLLWKDEKKDPLAGRELELAMEWYRNFEPDKNWASRYNELFDDCEKYLLESERIGHADLEEQERKDRRTKKLKIGLIVSLSVLIPLLSFFLGRELINVDWGDYDSRWEVASSGGEALDYHLFLTRNPDAPDNLRDQAKAKLKEIEEAQDLRNWQAAEESGSISAYENYLNLVGEYFNSDHGLYQEDAQKRLDQLALNTFTGFKSEELAWEAFQLSNQAFGDYLNYLIALDAIEEETVQQDSAVLSHKRIVEDGIESDKRVGWLFSGRLDPSKTIVISDATFEVVWREEEVENNHTIPAKGDFVRSLLVRSTYKEKIDNGGVFGINEGEPIRKGNMALVDSVSVVGNVVYYRIFY